MDNIIYQILFLFITIYILLKAIGYAIYEMKELHNKSGGITVIVLSSIIVFCANIVMFLK